MDRIEAAQWLLRQGVTGTEMQRNLQRRRNQPDLVSFGAQREKGALACEICLLPRARTVYTYKNA